VLCHGDLRGDNLLGDRGGGSGVCQLRGVPAHPAEDRCLKHCRLPLSLLLHYGAYRRRLRDVRAGAHHGAYCLGCCWSLMALFVVVGVMNLAAMVTLAAVVLAEKLWVTANT
jgi:predicted metal-binding membrane protein